MDNCIDLEVVAARSGAAVRVLDPACGDGRFLAAAARRVRDLGGRAELTGVDIDLAGLAAGDDAIEAIEADALTLSWGRRQFDVVVGNPPFLSQLSTSTVRDGPSRFGGGPYADASADFLALATRLARPAGGRVGLVLPVSLLTARDAGPIRAEATAGAEIDWFWWSTEPMFDALVRTCAVGLRRADQPRRAAVRRSIGSHFQPAARIAPQRTDNDHWGWLIADAVGVPPSPSPLTADGVLGDRALVTANFRDQYYALIGAVSDAASGPPLVTTGLIDPGRCLWGAKPTRFARSTYAAPRVDQTQLVPFMRRWAARCLVPKVLVATQTRVLEAVVDDCGEWLPAVPVVRVVAHDGGDLWPIAAVLTSPVASALIANQSVGSGLSAATVRVSQRTLGMLPWPTGDLSAAVDALRAGDLDGCGRAVDAAFGVNDPALFDWWQSALPRG